jgi:prepilin-type N-terminal cleavage/methylation domain-containing protein
MEKLLLPRRSRQERGFTLIETVVAIGVLTIGLGGVAALIGQTVQTTAKSRYMNVATMLASEKLEDLSRLPNTDPILIPGTYTDIVQISAADGSVTETTSSAGVTTLYTQVPGGNITVTPGAALPAATADTLQFTRTWTIVAGTPVAGVSQITVLVSLPNQKVSFQTSMVHP